VEKTKQNDKTASCYFKRFIKALLVAEKDMKIVLRHKIYCAEIAFLKDLGFACKISVRLLAVALFMLRSWSVRNCGFHVSPCKLN
jgi:CRISPR/Cas system CMR-associated protein Cmr3 (group 5 of RAMP superfamily)